MKSEIRFSAAAVAVAAKQPETPPRGPTEAKTEEEVRSRKGSWKRGIFQAERETDGRTEAPPEEEEDEEARFQLVPDNKSPIW